PSGWYHNFIKKFIYKKIISWADKIIVNSKDFKKEMEKKFKIHVECIFNPLNIIEIKNKSKLSNKDNFLKKNTLKIINIGRFTKQKDQITILKAVNKLKNIIKFRLLIIGRGEEEENLKNFIKIKKLNKLVKIKNTQKNPYKFINQADIFILSSKYEGLPNVLLEAAALKKFIISTDCPTGPREILNNGKGGFLFKVGNYIDLKNKILIYSKNRKNLNYKIKNTYDNLYKYDFNKNLKRYCNIINSYI
ncbi:glycosyltransferase, partial [Candidatus Pelagibacter sp.]|nr:glycosyltransferase [Candidatus Pelagibacter sp.]